MRGGAYLPPHARRAGGRAAEERTINPQVSQVRLVLPAGALPLDVEVCPLDIEHTEGRGDGAAGPPSYTLFHVDRQPDELLSWFAHTFLPGSGVRLEFQPSLSKSERAAWHHRAVRRGLTGQSVGVGEGRYLTISAAPAAGQRGEGGDAGDAPTAGPRLSAAQREQARALYDAAQLAGGRWWSLSRGESEALVASEEPLPADLQEVLDRYERGQGLHTVLHQGQEEDALALLQFDPKLAWHKDPETGGYPAHVAAWQGMANVLREVVQQPGVVEQRDGRRDTPLAVARLKHRAEAERVLLEAGAKPELASFADAHQSPARDSGEYRYLGLDALPSNFVDAALAAHPRLVELDLSSNRLSSLPDELSRLSHLQARASAAVVRLKYNALAELPAALRLPRLAVLEAPGNRIERLDARLLGALIALRTLDLSGNCLVALPEEVGPLPALEKLLLSNNRLAALPPALESSFPGLQQLDLSGNALARLPPGLSGLRALQRLDCRNNTALERVPPQLGLLSASLKTLDLRNCRLAARYQQAADKGLARFLHFLRDEIEVERAAEIERNRPKSIASGPCTIFKCQAVTEDAKEAQEPGAPPADFAWIRTGHALARCDNLVFLFGGTVVKDGRKSADLWVLNTDTMRWRLQPTRGDRPCARDGHAMALDAAANRVWVTCGKKDNGRRLNDLYFLDLYTWVWHCPKTDGDPPCPRDHACAAICDGKLVLFGGRTYGARLCDLWAFDLAAFEWGQCASAGTVPPPRQDAAMCTDGEGRLWLHGGVGHFVLDDLYTYNFELEEWAVVPTEGRWRPARVGHVIECHEGELRLFGGMDELQGHNWLLFEWVESMFRMQQNWSRCCIFHAGQLNIIQVGHPAYHLEASKEEIAAGRCIYDVFQTVALADLTDRPLAPEDLLPRNEKQQRIRLTAEERAHKLPRAFTAASPAEARALAHAAAFAARWGAEQPWRPPPWLVARNECHTEKLVCATLRRAALPHTELHDLEGVCRLLAEFFSYEALPEERAGQPPTHLASPAAALAWQAGDSFDLATLACSLLLGAGYRAFVAMGYSSRAVATGDQARVECPRLRELGVPAPAYVELAEEEPEMEEDAEEAAAQATAAVAAAAAAAEAARVAAEAEAAAASQALPPIAEEAGQEAGEPSRPVTAAGKKSRPATAAGGKGGAKKVKGGKTKAAGIKPGSPAAAKGKQPATSGKAAAPSRPATAAKAASPSQPATGKSAATAAKAASPSRPATGKSVGTSRPATSSTAPPSARLANRVGKAASSSRPATGAAGSRPATAAAAAAAVTAQAEAEPDAATLAELPATTAQLPEAETGTTAATDVLHNAAAGPNSPPPPPMPPRRYAHAFVLVLPGRRQVKDALLIDPATGGCYPAAQAPCIAVEAVWGDDNYFCNLQQAPLAQQGAAAASAGLVGTSSKRLPPPGATDWNLRNPNAWQALLPAQQADDADARTVGTELSCKPSIARSTLSRMTSMPAAAPSEALPSSVTIGAPSRMFTPRGGDGSGKAPPGGLALHVLTARSGENLGVVEPKLSSVLSMGYLAPDESAALSGSPTQLIAAGHPAAAAALAGVGAPLGPEIPCSWVPRLALSREALDVRCPRGSKTVCYRQARRELYAAFGECARWDGLVERVTTFGDAECTQPECVVELFQRRRDCLAQRTAWPGRRMVAEAFTPGAVACLRGSEVYKGGRRELSFYHESRADALMRRVDLPGESLEEHFGPRPDRLASRTVRYATPGGDLQQRRASTIRRGSVALNAAAAAVAAGGRKPSLVASMLANSTPTAKITECFHSSAGEGAGGGAGPQLVKRTYWLDRGRLKVVKREAGGQLTIRKYAADEPELLEGSPLPAEAAAAEWEALRAAARAAQEAVRAGAVELEGVLATRRLQDQGVQLVTDHCDAARVRVEDSGEALAGPDDEARDPLARFIPNTGARDMTAAEAACARDECLAAQAERLAERAALLAARAKEESAELARLEASLAGDRHRMGASDLARLEEQVAQAAFSTQVRMVKAYLRWEQAGQGPWGVITSANSNIVYDRSGRHLLTASLENVSVWNVKQAVLVRTLQAPVSESGKVAGEVTQIAASPVANQVAVGHADGLVRLWNLDNGECETTLAGHKSAVTALRYSQSGALLASGSKDTDVVVWDVAGEAGLFRLRGHRAEVTDLAFAERARRLVSCSKDEQVRAWDLDTQHCAQLLVGHRGEVWSLDVDPSQSRLATASSDGQLRVYEIRHAGQDGGAGARARDLLVPMGSVRRQAMERAQTLRYSAPPGAGAAAAGGGGGDGGEGPSASGGPGLAGAVLLTCQAAGKVVEVFRVRGDAEARRRLKRRLKRKREKHKGSEGGGEGGVDGGGGGAAEDERLAASDELEPVAALRSKHKVRSFAVVPAGAPGSRGTRQRGAAQLVLSLANNSLEVWEVGPAGGAGAGAGAAGGAEGGGGGNEADKVQTIDGGGHRSDVRAVALSSDDSMCLSASSSSVKVWNPRTGACLRTMESGYGLCAMFAPGDRHAVVGTKEGSLEIFDLGSGARTAVLPAHAGAVWSLAPLPDRSGFVSGSADHDVKFWEWSVEPAPSGGPRQLTATHTRTLRMTDDVLCVRVSPDGRLLAVALLDATVRLFFADSLKFFLSLYGHKLPVLAMDISSDSQLLATGSADKNLRIWGLDFGDCHRSLFAHADSVMAVAFVPNTHYLFTAGKDRLVKYWDADKRQLLLTLEGHGAEVWCLAVSGLGDFLLSGGHDRSLRRWERTQEPFFLEEEKERRLESLFEADLEKADQPALGEEAPGEEGAAAPAGRRTLESVGAADSIIEALDLAAAEEDKADEHRKASDRARNPAAKPPPPSPLLLGLGPEEYVLRAVGAVRPAELEQALLLLPFTGERDALRLLRYLLAWLAKGGQVELLCRLAALLLRLHHQQLMAAPATRPVLIQLQTLLHERVQGLKDTLGFNLAAMAHLQQQLRDRQLAPPDAAAALRPLKRKAEAAAGL
eukprot:scaffold3.g6380.t1